MNQVTVVTGAAGGMGLAAAKIIGKQHRVLISDLNEQRLTTAAQELREQGIVCDTARCDVSNRAEVDGLIARAQQLGDLVACVHSAGVSPQMGDASFMLRVNAVGTMHLTEACLGVAREGFRLVNVASMAAYMLPSILLPTGRYRRAWQGPDALLRSLDGYCRLMPVQRSGFAYAISKHFVIWYSKAMAPKFGEKGARIVSVSPGSFDTAMGRLEEKSGSAEMLKTAALKRFGKVEEIAEVLAFCASEKPGYLTATDILCDGGVVAGRSRS